MKKFLKMIVDSQDLTTDEKTIMIEKIMNVEKGNIEFVSPGFYLRIVEDKSKDAKDDNIQLWYRNVDPETNTTDHGNTGYDEQQIFNEMYNAMKSKNNGKSR